MRALLIALALLGAGCRQGTFLVVSVANSGPSTLTIGTLEVTITSAAHTGTVTYTRGTSFTIPPEESFVLEFEGDVPTDELTLDLVALRDGSVRATTRVHATLRRGETVHVAADFAPRLDGGPPDLALPDQTM